MIGATSVWPKPIARRLESAKWTWPISAPRVADRGGEIGFLDVHVKEVGEDADVLRLQRAQPGGGVAEAVEEVRLVAIQRLVEEGVAEFRGVLAEFLERLAEPGERLLAGDVALPAALHRADDRRRAERRGDVDDAADELAGLRANGGVRRA